MDETDYFLDLFRGRSKRVRRSVILLASVFAFMVINALSHLYEFNAYYVRLPGVLYDFSRKYDQPLKEWWQEYRTKSPRLRSTSAGAIPVRDGIELDEQFVPVDSIPLLRTYLTANLPDLRYRQRFLGWEIPTPLYLLVALSIPTVILVSMLTNVRFMRRTAVQLRANSSASKVVSLITASVLVDRISLGHKVVSRLHSVATPAGLFLLASASAMLVIAAPLMTWRAVQGTLYLSGSQFPQVVTTPVSVNPPAGWVGLWMTLVIANAIICAFIARDLAKME